MTNADRGRIGELLAIFAGREEIPNLGQFAEQDERRLEWAIKRGYVWTARRPWPGPLLGTCMKTWYVRVGC